MKGISWKKMISSGVLLLMSMATVHAVDAPLVKGQSFDSFDGVVGVIEDVSLASRKVVIGGDELYLPSSSVVTLLDEWGKPYSSSMRELQPGTIVKLELADDSKIRSMTEIRPKSVEQ